MTALIGELWAIVRPRLYWLALISLISLLLSYLVIHHPVTLIREALAAPIIHDFTAGIASPGWPLAMVTALALSLRDLLAVALLLAVSGALGSFVIRSNNAFNEVESPVLQALLGLGVVSVAILMVGLLGLFPSTLVAILGMLAVVVVLSRQIVTWVRSLGRACQFALATASPFDRWLRRAVILLLALSLLMALAPPTKWDALTYHLEAPRFYLAAGRIVSYPDNHFFGFPHLVEMLYLWLMIVARAQAAAPLHWAFGALTLMLVGGLARRINRPAAGVMAMIILLVCDSLWLELSWPYNDFALIAYVTAALISLLAWAGIGGLSEANSLPHVSPLLVGEGSAVRVLLLAGVFVGFAMSVKYTAAGSAVGIGCVALWLARPHGWRAMFVAGGMVSVVALLVVAPWLAKNALLDGNPVSPFVWGTASFDRFDQFYYLRPGTGLDWASALIAPLQGSVFGLEAKSPYGSSTGALIISLLPLAFIVPPPRDSVEKRVLSSLTVLIVPAYLIWLAGAVASFYLIQTRLLYPIFPALALIGAAGVERLAGSRHPINVHALSCAAIGLATGVAVIASAALFVAANTLPVTLGLQTEDAYLTESLGVFEAAMQRINALPANSKIVFLWEPSAYYCQRDCVPDSLINQWWHDRQLQPDPHRIADRWRAEGVTHVLIAEAGLRFLVTEDPYEPLTDADVAALNELRQSDLTLIWDGFSSYSLYELRAKP